jgi:hypothetical protein
MALFQFPWTFSTGLRHDPPPRPDPGRAWLRGCKRNVLGRDGRIFRSDAMTPSYPPPPDPGRPPYWLGAVLLIATAFAACAVVGLVLMIFRSAI